ncbi:hypothetical protein EXQ43_10940 [Clostridium botulinum]|nr:hypothetical protein [Clostridium botulinum]MBO0571856.1 hypothetical protein [Clostridium botulinum]
MAVDLIKSYLIGIGFDVDSNSAKDAETSIQITEEKIKKFNNNSKKGFSESGEAMKSLFNLFGSSSIGRLFPELQKPLNGLLKDIKAVKKIYGDLSKIDINKKEGKPTPKNIKKYTGKEKSIKAFKGQSMKKPEDNVKDDGGIDSGFKSLIKSISKSKKKYIGF